MGYEVEFLFLCIRLPHSVFRRKEKPPAERGSMTRRIVAAFVFALALAACGGTPAAAVTPDDVIAKFKAAGLEAEQPSAMDAEAYGGDRSPALTHKTTRDPCRYRQVPLLRIVSGDSV